MTDTAVIARPTKPPVGPKVAGSGESKGYFRVIFEEAADVDDRQGTVIPSFSVVSTAELFPSVATRPNSIRELN